MNNKQIELLKFLGFTIDLENNVVNDRDKNSLVSIYFNDTLKVFTLKISDHDFLKDDYDAIEYLSIELNRKLSLIYELNTFMKGDTNVCS